ncbi:MAG: RNA polymerase sigma factor [Planctomycetota bacterium]|jgi:RNA polymerase sigma-70 factor (ECF subfamily)
MDTTLYLQRWHDGDRDALDELIRHHLPWIYNKVERHLSKTLKAKGDPCDYVNDVLVKFLESAPRFNISNGNKFRALIAKIVKNTLLDKYDWFNARRRDIAREQQFSSDSVLSLDPPINHVETPSKIVNSQEQAEWIRLALDFLFPDDRELIILRDWEKMEFKQIGNKLDISNEAARMRYNRSLARLLKWITVLRFSFGV